MGLKIKLPSSFMPIIYTTLILSPNSLFLGGYPLLWVILTVSCVTISNNKVKSCTKDSRSVKQWFLTMFVGETCC